jgi:hypothetical protein
MRKPGHYSGRPSRTRPFGVRYLFQPRRMSESQYLERLRAVLGEESVRIIETPFGRVLSIREGRPVTPSVIEEYQHSLRDLVTGLRGLLAGPGNVRIKRAGFS